MEAKTTKIALYYFIDVVVTTYNAVHMKKGPDGFGVPTNQSFVFKPFILYSKNKEYLTALTD